MKKLILNSFISSLIFFGVGFFVIKGFAALSNVSSGTPLTASNWNDMISNFFWESVSGGIYYNGGNVGIGMTSGTSKLGIKSSGDGHGILIQANSNTNTIARLVQNNTDDGKLYLYSAGTIKTEINSNGVSYFNGGNVGIGITNPTSKLEVNGSIKANEICDENGANCKDISLGWGSSLPTGTWVGLCTSYAGENPSDHFCGVAIYPCSCYNAVVGVWTAQMSCAAGYTLTSFPGGSACFKN